MSNELRLASNLVPFDKVCDRFVSGGYQQGMPFEEQLDQLAKIEGLPGVALGWPCDVEEASALAKAVTDRGLTISALEPDIYTDPKFRRGSISNPDASIRRQAIERIKDTLDAAQEAGAYDVNLWPGQDGFDYLFAANYDDAWTWIIEAMCEVADHNPNVPIGLEYKPKEPRANQYVANAGKALMLVNKIDRANVGITVDVGHSLYALENPAEVAVLAMRESRLQQVHLNDNYRDWDHDLIPGAANPFELIELFYWVQRMGYDGWFNIDIFPYREDGTQCLDLTVHICRKCWRTAERLAEMNLAWAWDEGEHLEIIRQLWDLLG